MAKPDCDDGWLKYAHELDAALACADFSKGARIVLREVFAQIYGPAQLKAVSLSPSEIARRCGVVKTHIVRAIRELVESNVLSPQPDGSYRFNKDYEGWVRSNGRTKGDRERRPRLSKTEVAYAASAPAIAMAYKHVLPPKTRKPTVTIGVTDKRSPGNHRGTETVTIGVPSGNHRGTETVTIGVPFGGSPLTTPLVGGRLRDSLETGETPAGACEVGVPVSIPIEKGPTADPDELRRVQDKAEALFPLLAFDLKVSSAVAMGYPLAWVDAALESASVAGKPDWRYVHGILRRYQAQGGPDAPPAARSAVAVNGHAAPTVPPSPAQARRNALHESIRAFDWSTLAPREGLDHGKG